MGSVTFYYKDDCDYANKRLNNTFVLDKQGDLFLVLAVTQRRSGGKLIAQGVKILQHGTLDSGLPQWGLPLVECPAEDLNLAPLTLGYTISKRRKEAVFLARLPMRTAYKQGLYLGAVTYSSGGKSDILPDELLMPILNKYPKFPEAFATAKASSTSIPFSRSFAVTSKGDIVYRGSLAVGSVALERGQPLVRLAPAYAYLQQHLDWSLK